MNDSLDTKPYEADFITGGDRAAAHASAAIDTPVCRHGVCFRCLGKKPDWVNIGKCAASPRRNLCYQLAANHRDPRALMAEACEAAGKPAEAAAWRAAKPFECPHCAVVIDAPLEAKDRGEGD